MFIAAVMPGHERGPPLPLSLEPSKDGNPHTPSLGTQAPPPPRPGKPVTRMYFTLHQSPLILASVTVEPELMYIIIVPRG